ncbi:MAG: hypothetical protein RI953_972 [Pseudomonadota bacterium]|jgi:hypothetical protein
MKSVVFASSTLAASVFAVFGIAACGPTANLNEVATVSMSAQSMLDEDEIAPLGLTGLGDRVCRLSFSFVKKDAAGNYSVVGDGTTTDGLARTGFGRGCVNFCLTTFDELMKVNAANNVQILVKSCQFADMASSASAPQPAPSATPVSSASASPTPPPASAPQTAPTSASSATATPTAAATASPKPTATVVAAAEEKRCKIEGGAGDLLFAEKKSRADCVTECSKRDASNPQRSCEWGSEVLRKHPKNQCIIRGGAGKQLYQQSTTRFQCRMECSSRSQSNPNRSCLWGGENVK